MLRFRVVATFELPRFVEGADSGSVLMGKSVPVGPSTSGPQPGASRGPRLLTRQEFGGRVFARARDRYGLELDHGWLQDLIKDRLIERASRDGNLGLKPADPDSDVPKRIWEGARYPAGTG